MNMGMSGNSLRTNDGVGVHAPVLLKNTPIGPTKLFPSFHMLWNTEGKRGVSNSELRKHSSRPDSINPLFEIVVYITSMQ